MLDIHTQTCLAEATWWRPNNADQAGSAISLRNSEPFLQWIDNLLEDLLDKRMTRSLICRREDPQTSDIISSLRRTIAAVF
jgi:hypothetical protein